MTKKMKKTDKSVSPQLLKLHYCTRVSFSDALMKQNVDGFLKGAKFKYDKGENEYLKEEIFEDYLNGGYKLYVKLKSSNELEFSSFNIFDEKGKPYDKFESDLQADIISIIRLIADNKPPTKFDIHAMGVKVYTESISFEASESDNFKTSEITNTYKKQLFGAEFQIEEELEIQDDTDDENEEHFTLFISYNLKSLESVEQANYFDVLNYVLDVNSPVADLAERSNDYVVKVNPNAS